MLVETEYEIVLIECKSSKNKIQLGFYNKKDGSITKDSVKYFYDVYSKYVSKFPDKNVKFVFFAANGFEEKAINKMNAFSPKLKAEKLDFYYDYYSVKNKLLPKNIKLKDYVECWEKYFLRSYKDF